MKHHRFVLAVSVLASVVVLSGCGGSGSTANSSAPSKTPPGSASSSDPSTPASNTGSSSEQAKVSGDCSSIDKGAAEHILGSPTDAGLSSKTSGMAVGSMKKVDGCVYKGAAGNSLAYTVLRGNASFGERMIGVAKTRMTKEASKTGSPVTLFDAGLPNSMSFTQRLGAAVDSQITVLSGDAYITVAVARKDGNLAKAQTSAKAAAQRLVSSS